MRPPEIVSIEGCSLITIQTQIGPIIVSSKKNKFTSAAVINLGAIVIRTKGIATHITPIIGITYKSIPSNLRFSTKNIANIATNSFPITAAGTKFLFLAYLIIMALNASHNAVIKPNISPKKFPIFTES